MKLLIGDFAQMEGRVNCWLSNHHEKLEFYREGGDPYLLGGSQVFGRTITKADKHERQTGKVSELALGFGSGIGGLSNMCETYKVDMMPIYHILWSTTSPSEREKCESAYMWYLRRHKQNKDKDKKDPVSREIGFTCDLIKQRWRIANQPIAEYWKIVENGVRNAITTGQVVELDHGVAFFMHKWALHIRLPSGRTICFPYPEVSDSGTISYMGVEPTRKRWERLFTYGGRLTENIVQATQRDLLTDAMLRLDREGFTILLHIHDEIVCEEQTKTKPEFESIMAFVPEWAGNLPINVTANESNRYNKF